MPFPSLNCLMKHFGTKQNVKIKNKPFWKFTNIKIKHWPKQDVTIVLKNGFTCRSVSILLLKQSINLWQRKSTKTSTLRSRKNTALWDCMCPSAASEVVYSRCDTPAEKPISRCSAPCWMCRGYGEQSHRLRWLNLSIWMSLFVPLLQQHSPEADPRYFFCLLLFYFFHVVIEILWTNTGSQSVILDRCSRLLKKREKNKKRKKKTKEKKLLWIWI